MTYLTLSQSSLPSPNEFRYALPPEGGRAIYFESLPEQSLLAFGPATAPLGFGSGIGISSTGSTCTLKSAIDIVRPMYLTYVDAMLTKAGQELAEQLGVAETHHQVLVFHYIMRENPGMMRSETL